MITTLLPKPEEEGGHREKGLGILKGKQQSILLIMVKVKSRSSGEGQAMSSGHSLLAPGLGRLSVGPGHPSEGQALGGGSRGGGVWRN